MEKGFETLRAGAMVASVAAAPEPCALYLGSELWGTGATEGTKMEVRWGEGWDGMGFDQETPVVGCR